MEKLTRPTQISDGALKKLVVDHSYNFTNLTQRELYEMYYPGIDGFSIFMAMIKDYGIDVYRSDLEAADNFVNAVHEVEYQELKEWLKTHFPEPPFAIGDRLTFGEIVGINKSQGWFKVKETKSTNPSTLRVWFELAEAATA